MRLSSWKRSPINNHDTICLPSSCNVREKWQHVPSLFSRTLLLKEETEELARLLRRWSLRTSPYSRFGPPVGSARSPFPKMGAYRSSSAATAHFFHTLLEELWKSKFQTLSSNLHLFTVHTAPSKRLFPCPIWSKHGLSFKNFSCTLLQPLKAFSSPFKPQEDGFLRPRSLFSNWIRFWKQKMAWNLHIARDPHRQS